MNDERLYIREVQKPDGVQEKVQVPESELPGIRVRIKEDQEKASTKSKDQTKK